MMLMERCEWREREGRTIALMRALTRFGAAGVALVLLEARALAMISSLLLLVRVVREVDLGFVVIGGGWRDLLVLRQVRSGVLFAMQDATITR
jgi:hypothetical protein